MQVSDEYNEKETTILFLFIFRLIFIIIKLLL